MRQWLHHQQAHHQPTVCAITNSSNTVPLMTSQLTRFSSGMYSRQSLPYARSCRSCPSSGNRCYKERADGVLSRSHTAIKHGTTCLQVAVELMWISTLLCKVQGPQSLLGRVESHSRCPSGAHSEELAGVADVLEQ
jgi:hypothetical protein